MFDSGTIHNLIDLHSSKATEGKGRIVSMDNCEEIARELDAMVDISDHFNGVVYVIIAGNINAFKIIGIFSNLELAAQHLRNYITTKCVVTDRTFDSPTFTDPFFDNESFRREALKLNTPLYIATEAVA